MKVKVNKTNANNKKVTKTVQVELTTMQLFDDVSVTIETDTLADMEFWVYKTEDDLAYNLFDTERAYEDGKRDNLCIYTEDELNDMMVRAGLVANLVDKDSETYALSLAIIKKCVRFLDILHSNYDCSDRKIDKADPAERKMSKAELDEIYPWPTEYTDF